MKTHKFHHSELGLYAPADHVAKDGYITIHDSPRYARAKRDKLIEWCDTARSPYVRAAAAVELADRELTEWRCATMAASKKIWVFR